MIEDKYIIHNKRKYYLIDTVDYGGNNIYEYELYESTIYGEEVPHLIVNDSLKEAIGWSCNGFDELYDNTYTETIIKDYKIIK